MAPNRDGVVCWVPKVEVTPKELVVGLPKADWANGDEVVALLNVPNPVPVVVEPKVGFVFPNIFDLLLLILLLSHTNC